MKELHNGTDKILIILGALAIALIVALPGSCSRPSADADTDAVTAEDSDAAALPADTTAVEASDAATETAD